MQSMKQKMQGYDRRGKRKNELSQRVGSGGIHKQQLTTSDQLDGIDSDEKKIASWTWVFCTKDT